jgi:hypothetical protein
MNAFHWRTGPSSFCPPQPSADSPEERNRIDCRDRSKAKHRGMTLKEYRESLILVVNKESDIGRSTAGAGLRSDLIRRGGK